MKPDRAAGCAVRALADRQLPNGAFPTAWSTSRDMADSHQVASPFITGLILDLLQEVRGVPELEAIRERAVNYLDELRPVSGRFRFLQHGIDADLDDICLLNLVLQQARPRAHDYAAAARAVASKQTGDGWFPTWLRSSDRQPNDRDACVNVNVLRFLLANGVVLDAGWLEPAMQRWGKGADTLYYVQPYALLYFVCQLPLESRDRLLSMGGIGAETVESTPHQDVLDAALRLSVAVGLNADPRLIRSLVSFLLQLQLGSGAWPAWAAFQAFNYWGSESLTTAACIRGLWDAGCRPLVEPSARSG